MNEKAVDHCSQHLTQSNKKPTVLIDPSVSAKVSQDFWSHAFAIHGSITPHVIPNVLTIGVIANLICVGDMLAKKYLHLTLTLEIAPYEIMGAALGLVLVLRTNAGYDRWWEARKLWGGIVNQSRNLAISSLSYGPNEEKWQSEIVNWIAAYPHACRLSLRGETECSKLTALVGREQADRLAASAHMPSSVLLKISSLLKEACTKYDMDKFYFLQADKERALLLDHQGACERILKTPLALAYSIKIRRFIAIFLLTLPFALIDSLQNQWLVPLVTMLVAYPLFSLDQLGVELQNPFSKNNLSHLPLDDICQTIESNAKGVLEEIRSLDGKIGDLQVKDTLDSMPNQLVESHAKTCASTRK